MIINSNDHEEQIPKPMKQGFKVADPKPGDISWPYNELESVSRCPVCGFSDRKLLYSDLVDNVFFVAKGKWNLYQCASCDSAYIDPRPAQSSIHKAYGVYYTHSTSSEDVGDTKGLGFHRRVLRRLSNDFYNYHFGTQRKPENRLGRWVLMLFPGFYNKLKARFRFVGRPSENRKKLLDVGCGNGDYLALANEVGWQVTGVEPDEKALSVARDRGLNVLLGGIEQVSPKNNRFDVITISHVIEHVYDPSMLLKRAYELLEPGGTLYVETPNIEGYGAQTYKQNWRGLEVPRHLTIFSRRGLIDIIQRNGFSNLSFKSRTEVTPNIALKSYRMQLGESPYHKKPKRLPFLNRLKLFTNRVNGDEFLTVVAKKPK